MFYKSSFYTTIQYRKVVDIYDFWTFILIWKKISSSLMVMASMDKFY